jgi:phosphatidylglycerophosphate synthase
MTGSIPVNANSRAATDALLGGLRRGRWRPAAWRRFVGAAAVRSIRQAAAHPRAAGELTAVHGALFAVAPGRRWVATSWLLCLAHLGMLGERSSIGPATTVTLVRANLPALGDRSGPWVGLLALGSDVADGRLARGLAAETMFGGYADALADAAFWTWFATRYEPNRWLRTAAILAWAAPVGAIAAASAVGGRVVAIPRSRVFRPAAALQPVLAIRACGWTRRATAKGSARSAAGRSMPADPLPAARRSRRRTRTRRGF